MSKLSGYRLMRMMAMFDLPVLTKSERKRAADFRKFLLDQGFEMVQFSVYSRFAAGRERLEALTRKIGAAVPQDGKVDVLFFTDKQYEQIVSFRGKKHGPMAKKPEQLALF